VAACGGEAVADALGDDEVLAALHQSLATEAAAGQVGACGAPGATRAARAQRGGRAVSAARGAQLCRWLAGCRAYDSAVQQRMRLVIEAVVASGKVRRPRAARPSGRAARCRAPLPSAAPKYTFDKSQLHAAPPRR